MRRWQLFLESITSALIILTMQGCSPGVDSPATIGINPWPGYEILYLAEKKGFFDQVGANVKLVQLSSLADGQRAYISGRVDGFTSTLVESVQAPFLGGKPGKIVMVTDYSNGGDVIIARKSIQSVAELKGHKVGAEINSLGLYMLYRGLRESGLTLNDVQLVNAEQLKGERALKEGEIDAFVTYPPASVNILANDNYHLIFSSADIPGDIIDVLTLSEEIIAARPELPKLLLEAWQLALNYTREFPDDAFTIMAEREGISAQEFAAVITQELRILDSDQQMDVLGNASNIDDKALEICQLMVELNSISGNCQDVSDIVYRY